MPVVQHKEWEYHDPLVLVGFPSQGLVGSVTASFLIPKVDMELVASLHSDRLPPVASIRDGRAVSPVQMYASTYRCGLDGECDQLIVVRADAAPNTEHAAEVTREILDWTKEIGARMVVPLEGADPDVESQEVFAVQNLECDVDLEPLNVTQAPEGGLGGIAAALLVQGNDREVPVLCLYTAASEDQADASAASRLIANVDNLVPGIAMDPDPLRERARQLQDDIRQSRDRQRADLERVEDASSIMYR
jgi:uncharacterized protein